MDKKSKFLGISIILASLIIGFGLIINGAMQRYTFYSPHYDSYRNTMREDRFTGEVYMLREDGKLPYDFDWVQVVPR